MTHARKFQIDELVLRPGTYFNPQTEVMIVVDDTPEVDHELFEGDDLEESEWVLISDETPLDESKRDDLVERFQLAHQTGTALPGDDDVEDEEDGLEEDEEDELDGVDDLEFERE